MGERSQRACGLPKRLQYIALLLALASLTARAQQPGACNWQVEVRERVAAHQLNAALQISERRPAEAPQDLEAHGWRARLLARLGQLPEAETEFRLALNAAPQDTDLALGLAQVLLQQHRPEEALELLTRAHELDPRRPDILASRGSVLRAMGRVAEARADLRAAQALDPRNFDARMGLDSLHAELRHQLRIGVDTDSFNFAARAWTQTISLDSRWNTRWSTSFTGNFFQRFAADVGKFTGSATYRFTSADAFTAGGGAGHDQGIIARREAFFEYGHGFQLSETRFLRGLETSYRQQWLWFAQAQVLTVTGAVVAYLPREWTWSLALAGARSRFPGTGAEWRPSGRMRLDIPLHPRLTGQLFYAVGTENFAQADQIGRFSARTYGGGVKLQLTSRQDLTGFVAHQERSQGKTQLSFGLSYGIHF